MSIFLEKHHDQLLLPYLDIDTIKILSQVNKHYYDLTRDILQPFITFFASIHTIEYNFNKYENNDSDHNFINISTNFECSKENIMFIQSIVHNDLSVAKYVYKKYKPNILDKCCINGMMLPSSKIYYKCEANIYIYASKIVREQCNKDMMEWFYNINISVTVEILLKIRRHQL